MARGTGDCEGTAASARSGTPTPAAKKVTARDLFETEPCHRCGGSGRYSYNQIHGDTCYGCGGRGRVFSKKGAAALEAWKAIWKQVTPVTELRPGDRVRIDDVLRNRWVVLTVASVAADPHNEGVWMVHFEPGRGIDAYGFVSGAECELAVSAQAKRDAYAQIADMPGALGWPAA